LQSPVLQQCTHYLLSKAAILPGLPSHNSAVIIVTTPNMIHTLSFSILGPYSAHEYYYYTGIASLFITSLYRQLLPNPTCSAVEGVNGPLGALCVIAAGAGAQPVQRPRVRATQQLRGAGATQGRSETPPGGCIWTDWPKPCTDQHP
jgi:hypothetical protein